MASDELTLWKPNAPVTIPPDVDGAQIAAYARQLSARERQQIEYAFTSGSYEMGTSFLWKKAMDGLRRQLASLGMEFVGEMLDRSDITADSSIQHVVTDYEALTLAEELGMFNTTQTMRLRQAMEMVMRCRCVRPLAGLRRPESARSPLSSRCGLLTFRADLRQYVRVHDSYTRLNLENRPRRNLFGPPRHEAGERLIEPVEVCSADQLYQFRNQVSPALLLVSGVLDSTVQVVRQPTTVKHGTVGNEIQWHLGMLQHPFCQYVGLEQDNIFLFGMGCYLPTCKTLRNDYGVVDLAYTVKNSGNAT
ncbi:MAG: hypothetical protein MJE77_35110 [Proteobacteria bacterium]|nr:hypothetical protein [Pseudomonadota bacterium]